MSAPLRRVVAPLGRLDEARLLAWFGAGHARGEAVAAWLDPERGLAWAARGAAASGVAADLGALAGTSSALAELVVDAATDEPAGLPRVVVGAAFDPLRTTAADDPWAGWPQAWAMLPERLVWTRDGQAGVVLHLPLDASVDDALERAREELALAAGDAPAPERAADAEVIVREGRGAWAERVEAALRAIERGELRKVVLARGALQGLGPDEAWDPAATLARLGGHDARAVRFAVAPGASAPAARGCFVGATPELLVHVLVHAGGRRVDAVALAGTCRRGADPADDEALGAALLASGKDLHEHALVAEHVREALAPLCARLDAPARPGLRRLRHVQHLETRFTGELQGPGGLLELGARLHPTPALGGAPRAAALAWLRAHEPLDRGWYAGVVGFVDARGGGTLAVAIRSALLDGPRAWTFAGAGIVAGSDPAAEWDETALKLRTVERALQARALETGVSA